MNKHEPAGARFVCLASLVVGSLVAVMAAPSAAVNSAAAASDRPCTGTRIEHIAIKKGGTPSKPGSGPQYGWLDVYYENDGDNCAVTRSHSSTDGIKKGMEVRLVKCRQTTPGPDCTPVDEDKDSGQFEHFAGYVRVHAPNNCIYAEGFAGLNGGGYGFASTMITNGGKEASHCA